MNQNIKLCFHTNLDSINIITSSLNTNKSYLDVKTILGILEVQLNKKRYNNHFISNFRTFGNHLLTFISNFFNNQKLTDAHTCYKVFKSEIFVKLNLQENDFAFFPEVTTKISTLNEDIKELSISYKGRTIREGKKISFYDAIRALITILKYRFFYKSDL